MSQRTMLIPTGIHYNETGEIEMKPERNGPIGRRNYTPVDKEEIVEKTFLNQVRGPFRSLRSGTAQGVIGFATIRSEDVKYKVTIEIVSD